MSIKSSALVSDPSRSSQCSLPGGSITASETACEQAAKSSNDNITHTIDAFCNGPIQASSVSGGGIGSGVVSGEGSGGETCVEYSPIITTIKLQEGPIALSQTILHKALMRPCQAQPWV